MSLVLVVLLVASIALNVLQGKKIKASKKRRCSETRIIRKFMKGLILESCSVKNENDDLKRRLEELERKFKESEKRLDEVERKVEILEEANGIMANNTFQLLKEERIIKSTYNNVVFPYKFHELTQEEVKSFFGRLG